MTAAQLHPGAPVETRGPYKTPVSSSPRPFGYYWIQVEQDGPWIAAFWYEGGITAGWDGYFDCSNILGPADRLMFDPSAIGGLIDLPHPFDGVPQSKEQPSGYHWVQGQECGEWVVALWRDEPYERFGVKGRGYFDASNYWNSSTHFISAPHVFGDRLDPIIFC